MRDKNICQGFPEHGSCTQPVRTYPWGKEALWCEECDKRRMDTISASMDRMEREMARREAEYERRLYGEDVSGPKTA